MKTIKYLKLKGKKEIKTMKRIMLGSNGPGMREKVQSGERHLCAERNDKVDNKKIKMLENRRKKC